MLWLGVGLIAMDDLRLEDDVAIIGMAGCFPGAESIEQFWHNLKQGIESIQFFSDAELHNSGITTEQLQQPNYVNAKAALNHVAYFDADFFGFTEEEATITDPQQRLFLECAWEALESAGYNPNTCNGSIGLYGGMGGANTYLLRQLLPHFDLDNPEHNYKLMLGNDKDFLCTRISHKLNLTGPSVTVQTACSTSLVAVSMACQALLDYQCDMALAGGVSISFPQKTGYLYKQGMIFSPDGHCRTFDANANGTVPGNGAGIVLLKRLDSAMDSGDTIHAVIRGTAINNDGAHKMSYTTPSVTAQTQAISETIAIADVAPETIGYVETHGTATLLGDSIEVTALTHAYRSETEAKQYCALGSVKTNIGYLEAAAGVTGLIKAILAVKHGQIPPTLHFKRPNPQMDLVNSPFYVNTDLQNWPSQLIPRRAAVNAFGVGGTNAHVILEQPPAVTSSLALNHPQLVVLSARTPNALQQQRQRLLKHFNTYPELNLRDIAYTLQVGRVEFEYRSCFLCDSVSDAIQHLNKLTQLPLCQNKVTQSPTLVFMFDDAKQAATISSTLYETETVFREQLDYCAHFLHIHLQLDLREILIGLNHPTVNTSLLNAATIDASIFVMQYALAKLWISWGIQPQAVLGRGVGEYVAACLAGVFSLEEALLLVIERGHIYDEFDPTLPIAHQSSVTSEAIERFSRTLNQTEYCNPQLLCLSAAIGGWVQPSDITNSAHWLQKLHAQDHIQHALNQLPQSFENTVLLDISPKQTLYKQAKQILPEYQQQIFTTLKYKREDTRYILKTLGKLWLQGVSIDWKKLYIGEQRLRIPLPTYPFERKLYWFDPDKN